MSFINIYIHFVWSTKNRKPFLYSKEIRSKLWNHIKENAVKKDIHIDFINGYSEHCHCLISLKYDQSIQSIAQLLKGESSHWINKENILSGISEVSQDLIDEKFEWQDEYFAVSVSHSIIDKVREYIKNQEEHHSKKSYLEEENELISRFGFISRKY